MDRTADDTLTSTLPARLDRLPWSRWHRRVVAALAGDPSLSTRSGQALVAAAEALRLGVVDVDGKRPAPLSLQTI